MCWTVLLQRVSLWRLGKCPTEALWLFLRNFSKDSTNSTLSLSPRSFYPVLRREPLPLLMMEHILKVMTTKYGRHGLAYGYLLNYVFDHFGVQWKKGVLNTIKQSFSQNTLVKCECSEGRAGKRSKSQDF